MYLYTLLPDSPLLVRNPRETVCSRDMWNNAHSNTISSQQEKMLKETLGKNAELLKWINYVVFIQKNQGYPLTQLWGTIHTVSTFHTEHNVQGCTNLYRTPYIRENELITAISIKQMQSKNNKCQLHLHKVK